MEIPSCHMVVQSWCVPKDIGGFSAQIVARGSSLFKNAVTGGLGGGFQSAFKIFGERGKPELGCLLEH